MRIAILTVASLWAAWMVVSPVSAQEPTATPSPTVTPEPTATPAPTTGSITITLDTNPETEDRDFCFDVEREGPGDPDDFCIEDDEAEVLDGLSPDDYTVQLKDRNGWQLDRIDCAPESADTDEDGPSVTVDLDAGDEVECRFVVEEAPEPTATAEPTAVPATPVPPVVSLPTIIVVPAPAAPAPVAPTARPPVTIRPPSTGNGGLIN